MKYIKYSFRVCCVWVIFLLFVYIVSSQIPYIFVSKSTLPNVMSHFLLGGLIFYYSLFVETVVLWDIKMLSLQLCDTVVSLLSGVGLIATQHNFFQKNVSSNEWSDKDIQHTALGVVLILVGVCNVLGILSGSCCCLLCRCPLLLKSCIIIC